MSESEEEGFVRGEDSISYKNLTRDPIIPITHRERFTSRRITIPGEDSHYTHMLNDSNQVDPTLREQWSKPIL